MEQIHIARDRQRLGTFSPEEVREGLRSGRFFPTDLGWRAGMESWTTLAIWPEFSGITRDPAAPEEELKLDLPAAPPPPAPQTGMPGDGGPGRAAGAGVSAQGPAEAEGLPWENREGRDFFGAMLGTVKLVLLRPSQAFSIMRREGGLAEPLMYVAILASVGMLAAMFYNMGFEMLVPAFSGQASSPPAHQMIGMLLMIPLIPVLVVIGAFLGAGVTHLCLMLVGGANRPFETTFRVFAYAWGSTSLVQVVPFCGAMVAGVWNLVASIIGLAKAHEIPTWKSVLAIFLPTILCCGLVGAALGILFAAAGPEALKEFQQQMQQFQNLPR
jgi:hypothetical protein